MDCPPEVLNLVERFERELDSYRSGKYNETQVRREFIDPMFKTLGWDIDNTAGYAEAYKDVIHEDAIKVGTATKAPDYCFRVGGTRKFFLEAKKPSINVKEDVAPAFQLRRYAWSAKLPLSVLTDFEEFAVYDCRVKPEKQDKASAARILYLNFREYPARWEEITSIFSRDAVLKGSFDRFADSSKRKKGTAEVDAAFLAEIEEWRDTLARNLALRNPTLFQRELNFAVQQTIDRIIFLRICEDRGVEVYGQLREAAKGPGIYPRLLQLFVRADHRYNSGLFHFEEERGRSESPDLLTPSLTIEDKPLRDIIASLYYPDSPYEFSVLPADILGQVYEQFLGKVIRLTGGHRAVVEDKPEVKKAGGVYYTPTYIVDYIVKHTVGPLLEGNTPKQAAELRVLDPACGSGSFLIGAYQYLLDWHRDWYVADGIQKHRKQLYEHGTGDHRVATDERKRILINSIYGVDIDPQAVEVTKLSLLLKVLEGESAGTLDAQLQFLQDRALPDLDANIRCGNSLIGSDFYDTNRPGLLSEEDQYRINVFDWEAEFPAIMAAGGFDAVIGNPPYIRIHRLDHRDVDYYFSRYFTLSSKTDLSQVFIERSLSLVNEQGYVGLICTSQWMTTDYGKGMRGKLASGMVHGLVDFGSLPVFAKASTYPAILILRRQPGLSLAYVRIDESEQLTLRGIEDVPPVRVPHDRLTSAAWNLTGLDLPALLTENNTEFDLFGSLAPVQIGALTGMDAVFVVDRRTAEEMELEEQLLLPYANRGKEVIRYGLCRPENHIIYPYEEGRPGQPQIIPEERLERDYPRILEHLRLHKSELVKRQDTRKLYATGLDWYRYLRPGTFGYIRPRKIILKGIGKTLDAGLLAENSAFSGANCPAAPLTSVTPEQELYLLGILNSELATEYMRAVCPPKLNGYRRFTARALARFPIPRLDRAPEELSTSIVDSAVAIREVVERREQARLPGDRARLERRVAALERNLNALVYELFHGRRPS
ncbi:MAG: Eco57I restriction-modification methylase domain-containing protein [Thermoleophilia bacterium]